MNRSIFQALIGKCFFYIIISIFLLFIIFLNNNIYCFSIRGMSDSLLKELKYENIIFKCSKSILDIDAFNSLNLFLTNKSHQNLNFSVSKYYSIENGFVIPFNLKTCYAHPNLFFGVYNKLYFNLQFSHTVYNNNFDLFTTESIVNLPIYQYLSNQLYIYDNNLYYQFLNFNQLNLNKNVAYYDNLDSVEIQNYINFNYSSFKNIVNKSLNF